MDAMSPHTQYERIDVDEALRDEFIEVDSWAFGMTLKADAAASVARSIPWERARGLRDTATGQLAAIRSSFAFQMRVPGGGTVPTAGLTWVGVHPSHRRKGLLTEMIADHFERSLARGEHVSTLFAAEPDIYQRFGYGLAAPAYSLKLSRGVKMRPIAGADDLSLTFGDASVESSGAAVRAVLRRATRPGYQAEVMDGNLEDVLSDLESWREGRERKRFALVEDGEGPVAFATFARKGNWGDAGPEGVMTVFQWASVNAAATQRLFKGLTNMDLVATIEVGNIAVGDPVVHMITDIRAVLARMSDNLWVRILDLPGALGARTFASDAEAVIKVTDAQLPQNDGLWRVRIASGQAHVSREANSDVSPDISASIQELSAAYLGGITLAELAIAGLVSGDARAIGAMSAAWAGLMKPVSALNF